FEQFLRDNPRHAKAVDARFELARMVAVQGRQRIDLARRQESKAAQRDLIVQARPLFADAAAKLQDAGAAIDAELRQSSSAGDTRDLAQLRQQARLEEGVNLVHQGMTFLDAEDVKQRTEVLKRANDMLTRLSSGESDDPVTWQAKVWLGRLAEEEE